MILRRNLQGINADKISSNSGVKARILGPKSVAS